VLADETADPVHVAADLISQAEHDPLAASCSSPIRWRWPMPVDVEVERQVGLTSTRADHLGADRRAVGHRAGARLSQGLAVGNAYAAEHLELITADAASGLSACTNPAACSSGRTPPVSLGDTARVRTNVLGPPDDGPARSGLSVQSFLKGVHMVE